MQQNCMIKICGIRSPEVAANAAKLGADFIGIVFHPASKRYVDLDQAKDIALAAKQNGAKPVAVFVNSNADEMLCVCETIEVNMVQLHGDISRAQHVLLPKSFQRIYSCAVTEDGKLHNPPIKNLDKTRDYLLFDNLTPGSGETFSWEKFDYLPELPWILAGGLNPENVEQALQQLQPNALDVSTGVEDATGEKSLNLIQEFITAVKLKQKVHAHA